MQLSSSLNSTTILETYIDHLQQVAPFRSAHILLLNDEDQLVVRLAREDEDYLPPTPMLGQQFSIAEMPLVQTMLREGQIQSLADISIYPHYALSPYHPAIHSWVGIPLVAGDKAIGLCTLEHEAVGFFTQEQIDWATALTGQAVVAIQNAWLFEQVQDNRERLQALSRRLVEVQELERHHIARELHDEAGQALASLMVGLRLLERDGVDRETVGARCQELKQIADGVMENLHRLAIDLRPASLDHLGLVAALRQQSKLISDQHEITVRFETVGKIDRLPEEIETAIYRIVQEALTNVVRHARANRVDVLLERRSQSLLVVVEDNGIGFDPSRQAAHNLGLVGMHERAEMLGGTLSIESTAGVGTTILLEVACPSD
jgi:signal transduction histidine kinase